MQWSLREEGRGDELLTGDNTKRRPLSLANGGRGGSVGVLNYVEIRLRKSFGGRRELDEMVQCDAD